MCSQCKRVLATLQHTLQELMGLRHELLPGVGDGAIERLRAPGKGDDLRATCTRLGRLHRISTGRLGY